MTSLIILKSLLFAKAVQESKKNKRKNIRCIKLKVSDLSNMCRICCSEEGEILIFSNEKHPNMPKEITQFSGVDVNKHDDFPKHICQSCHRLLQSCIKFRDLCNMSNKRLSELCVKKETIKIINDISIISNDRNDIEESYNIPSPTFSDENTELWTCTTCRKDFQDVVNIVTSILETMSKYDYNNHLAECIAIINERKQQNGESKKKAFLCDICGKTTRSNANLLVHKAIHENVFPFKCDQCPYRGRTTDLLKVHKRSHLIDKPYKCTQCPKATTTSSNLAKHMRHVHSTNRPHKCTYCDKAFSYQHDMKRHVRDIHLRQGTVECEICFKRFNTKKILQGHRWKVHKIKSDRHGRLPSYLHYTVQTA